jgi:glycosyltransferase involved in cell wall biosynthesis
VLAGSPVVLGAEPAALAQVLTASTEQPQWTGSLDSVSRTRIDGWAFDARAPHEALTLLVLVNGKLLAEVLANAYRRDLAEGGIGDGRHAFTLHVPGGLAPLERHVIEVLGASDGCALPGSPVVIEAATGFDATLEQAVASAVDALANRADQERVLEFLWRQTERLLQRRAELEAGRDLRDLERAHLRRWGRGLGPAEAPGLASRPSLRRRALVIDATLPAANLDAGSTAILSHAQALRTLGYDVSIAAAESAATDADAVAALEAIGISCCRAPFYATVEEVLGRQRGCFDLIYLHRVSSAMKYLALARAYAPRARVLYSVADLHHLRVARQAVIEERAELKAVSERLRVAECLAAASADAVLTHSPDEARRLGHAVKGCNVHVVPWAVPLGDAAQADASAGGADRRREARDGIAFIGNFGFAPNLDAAYHLAREIMPRVWRVDPSIGLTLVGSRMPLTVMRLAAARDARCGGIVVLGQVPTLDATFASVRMTVAPLRYGAGIKGKVLGSLAAAVPCVLSPIAAEGLDLPESLVSLLCGDATSLVLDADDFATRIVSLYGDAAAALALGRAGRAYIAERYTQERVVTCLEAALTGRSNVAIADVGATRPENSG